MDLNIETIKVKDVMVVRLQGRIDVLTSPIAEKQLLNLVDSGESKILLNCAGVTYISSAGIRMFLMLAKKLDAASGKIILCSATDFISEMLKISGIESVVPLVKDEEKGLLNF